MKIDIELGYVSTFGGFPVNALGLHNNSGELVVLGRKLIAASGNDEAILGRAITLTNATTFPKLSQIGS